MPVFIRDLREGEVEYLNVVGRGVRPGPTRAQDAGQGLTRVVQKAQQRVVAKGLLLMWSDIRGSVEQFAKLRAEHTAGRRLGTPKLVVVSNTAPGPDLLRRTQQPGWPAGVSLVWPGHPDPQETWLPPAAADLTGVLQWCTEQAAQVPFGSLGAQTLV